MKEGDQLSYTVIIILKFYLLFVSLIAAKANYVWILGPQVFIKISPLIIKVSLFGDN